MVGVPRCPFDASTTTQGERSQRQQDSATRPARSDPLTIPRASQPGERIRQTVLRPDRFESREGGGYDGGTITIMSTIPQVVDCHY